MTFYSSYLGRSELCVLVIVIASVAGTGPMYACSRVTACDSQTAARCSKTHSQHLCLKSQPRTHFQHGHAWQLRRHVGMAYQAFQRDTTRLQSFTRS